MDYSPGIIFQTGIINTDKANTLTMNNQPIKSTDKGKGAGMAPQSTYVSPQRIDIQEFITETQKKALEMGLSQQEANKSAEGALSES